MAAWELEVFEKEYADLNWYKGKQAKHMKEMEMGKKRQKEGRKEGKRLGTIKTREEGMTDGRKEGRREGKMEGGRNGEGTMEGSEDGRNDPKKGGHQCKFGKEMGFQLQQMVGQKRG